MKIWQWVMFSVAFLILLILIFGYVVKPGASSIDMCHGFWENRSELKHIDMCYYDCCDDSFIPRIGCENRCYLID